MTFNIRYGTARDGPDHWDRRRELLVDTIKKFDPDLLGTQETLLEQALAVNPDDVPANRLATLIAQRRARLLQARVDELFTDAAAHSETAPRLAVAPPVPHAPVRVQFR